MCLCRRRVGGSGVASILIVDDEANIRWIFGKILADAGYQVRSAESGAAARQLVREQEPDLVFLDYQLPDTNGLELMRSLKAEGCAAQFIVITAFESVKTAVAAVKEGAFDYLSKPIDNEEILLSARRALEVSHLRRQVANYRETLSRLRGPAQLVGGSPALQAVVHAAERAAGSDINVLLTGESGTGKDLVAHLIHDLSARRDGPFVVVDCGALPETLAESEIFGHEKGAFTGAASRSVGKFALAHGGTLFLDEIGNAPASLQAKLLRAIETKTFDRLGGRQPVHTDARVVAATNRDLRRMDAAGGVPRRPLLPARRLPHRDPAAARARRRHPGAGGGVHREDRAAAAPRRRPARAERPRPCARCGTTAGRGTSASCAT